MFHVAFVCWPLFISPQYTNRRLIEKLQSWCDVIAFGKCGTVLFRVSRIHEQANGGNTSLLISCCFMQEAFVDPCRCINSIWTEVCWKSFRLDAMLFNVITECWFSFRSQQSKNASLIEVLLYQSSVAWYDKCVRLDFHVSTAYEHKCAENLSFLMWR